MEPSRTPFKSNDLGGSAAGSAAPPPRLAVRRAAELLAGTAVFAGLVAIALERVAGLSDAGGAAIFGFASAVFWLTATLLSFRPVKHRRAIIISNLLAASCAAAAACYVVPGSATRPLGLLLSWL